MKKLNYTPFKRKQSKFRKHIRSWSIKAGAIALLGFFVFKIFFAPVVTEAAWYDDNYNFREKVTFGNTGAADSNKKVKLDVDTATLITAGKMQADCDDTRFTDINGKLLSYYLDSAGGACNTASTDYYVLVPTINGSSNDTVLYMYYGNTLARAGTLGAQLNQSTFSPTSGPTFASEEKAVTPVLYWKFDDNSGTTAQDSSTFVNTGTTSNITWINTELCFINTCLKFNGTTSKVTKSFSSDKELEFGTGNFSVSTWFKHPYVATGTDTLIARSNSIVNGVGYKIYMKSTGVICFGIDDSAGSFPADEACSTSTYIDSSWHLVEAVKTTTLSLYIDGKLAIPAVTVTATGNISGSSSTFNVGVDGDGASNFWDGFIDEVKIYNYARSAAQAKMDYVTKSTLDQSDVLGLDIAKNGLANGLVGYWKMDETAANSCTGGTNDSCDASGNVNDGAWTANATTTAAGRFASAVTFDGTGDYVSVADSVSLSPTSSISFGSWIKPNSSIATKSILVKNTAYRLVTDGSGNPQCQIYNGAAWQTAATSSTAVTTGTWYHVFCTYDGSTIRVFVNGLLKGSTTNAVTVNDSSAALEIGRDSTASFGDYNGSQDDTRVYNRTLSSQDVMALYSWGPAPMGYWRLDEGSGTSTTDASGNSITGTLNTGPTWKPGKFGRGVKFDGVDDDISLGNTNNLSSANTMTITAWIYPTAFGEGQFGAILSRSLGFGSDNGYEFEIVSDGVSCQDCLAIWDGEATFPVTTDQSIVLNQWQHVAVVVDNNVASFYINGALATLRAGGKTTAFTLAAQDTIPAFIGSIDGSSDTWAGNLDEVKYYNYARNSEQIVEDMNAGHAAVGSPISSAIAKWSFDEGYSTTAHDKSTFGNDLTLSTASWTATGKFGKAWNGTGANWLSKADDPDFDFAAGEDFTLSTWVRSDSSVNPSTAEYIMSKESSSAGYAIWFATNGEIVCGIDDDASSFPEDSAGDTASNIDYYDANWHQVVCTRSTTTGRLSLYIDGKLFDTDSTVTATGSLENSDAFTMGSRNTANDTDDFFGDIDETRVYRYALDDSQVKIDYNQGQAEVLGSLSTASNGATIDNSNAREYCVPGDTSACSPPTGQWDFNERTGVTVNDTSGNAFAGTFTGAPTWVPGKVGSATLFNGSTQYATIGNVINFSSSSFTIEAWVNRTNVSADQLIISKKLSSTLADVGYMIEQFSSGNGGNTCLYVSDGTNKYETCTADHTTETLGTWQHIVAVYDRTNGNSKSTIYINGVDAEFSGYEVGNATTVANTTNTLGLCFAARANTAGTCTATLPYAGKLDNVLIYNYARTPAQVAWDYNKGKPTAWYKFDECTGSTIYNAVGTTNTGTITIGGTGTYTSLGNCNSGTATEAWNGGSNGKYNSALGFDGTNDHILINPMTAISYVQGAITAWVYPTASSPAADEMIVMGNRETNRIYLKRKITTATLTIQLGTDSAIDSGKVIPVNTWTHIAMAWDNGTYYIFMNGVQIATGSYSVLNGLDGFSSIGSYDDNGGDVNSYFAGLIDDVRIFSYAPTKVQMRNIYNQDSAIQFAPVTGQP